MYLFCTYIYIYVFVYRYGDIIGLYTDNGKNGNYDLGFRASICRGIHRCF